MNSVVGVKISNAAGRWSDRVYDFKAYEKVNVGDMVVIETVNGFLVGEVVEVKETSKFNPLKEVINVVDFSPWVERRRKEARRKELKEQMDKRVAKLQEDALYKMLAKEDQELAELLNEYETL